MPMFPYLTGQGVQDIAEELNKNGVLKTFGSDCWHHSTVSYILKNINYTGDMMLQKSFTGDTVPFKRTINKGQKTKYYIQNDHPAIIIHEDFEKVQELMERRRKKSSGKVPEKHLLTEKIICENCGKIHRRKVTNDKIYWVCRNHDYSKDLCPSPQIPESEIYTAFARMWNKLHHHRQDIIIPMLEQYQAIAERRYQLNDRIGQVNKELQNLSDQAHVLKRLSGKGCIEPVIYFDKMREIQAQLKDLRALKISLMQKDQVGSAVDSIKALNDILESGPQWLDNMDESLFDEIVEQITVISPERIKIRLRCGLELTENIEKVVR